MYTLTCMTTTTIATDIPEDDLRCEYSIRIFGRFIDIVCLKGSFDLPLALGNGWLGGDFCREPCIDMLHNLAANGACLAFLKFCQERKEKGNISLVPGPADQPVEPQKTLHETVRAVDLRFETAIRVFGRNIEVLSLSGEFTMSNALDTCLLDYYKEEFGNLLSKVAMMPAQIKLNVFFDQRQRSLEMAERKDAKETHVDEQEWNFGSENLSRAMEQEPEAERKAA
jgi:hypothetical protein